MMHNERERLVQMKDKLLLEAFIIGSDGNVVDLTEGDADELIEAIDWWLDKLEESPDRAARDAVLDSVADIV